MKLIEFRGRMLRCSEIWVRRLRKILDKCRRQAVTDNHHRRVQRDVRRWQYARRLRGNHSLAAVVALVRRVAGHRATALHALLILGQRGHAVPKLQHHRPQEGFSRLPGRTVLYSCPHSIACCRGWRLWPGFDNWKGDHPRISSVRSVEAANSSSEVVVLQADSLVGGGVSLDRLDRLLHKHHYEKFCCCFVASVDPFRVVVCRHVPTDAGSALETQSVCLQASLFPVATFVHLPTLWHFNGG